MARSRKKSNYLKGVIVSFWLLWSLSGSILFSFGLLALFNGNGKIFPIIIGAVMVIFAILTGKFTTETALAMRMKR